MKKFSILLAVLVCAAALAACGKASESAETPGAENAEESKEQVEISLWTYPIGNLGNSASISGLLADFHKKYPNIHVSVEHLTYDNGDEKIEQALKEGNAPDLVLEGPERLVANWGERGLMVELSDLWEGSKADMIYENVKDACGYANGSCYEFPICMTAHCMAINYDMFREAGALQYIDEENRTWTTDGFVQAVQALSDYGIGRVGVIYCKNQSGDQGTRALVNNLYGGTFTDAAHTVYTIDSEENIKALQLLYDLEGIVFEPQVTASEAVALFSGKETAMTFCWNVSLEVAQTINTPNIDFDIFPMAFPSDDGKPLLECGIWGFGIFDSKDEQRIEAAKTFIRFMTEEDAQYAKLVRSSTYWPVRDMDNIYENDMLMTEYSIFTPYTGDYYQITPGWPAAREAWWKLLQKVGVGADIEEAVAGFPAL